MTEVINLRGHHLRILDEGLRYLANCHSESKDVERLLYERYKLLNFAGYSNEHVKNDSERISKIIKGKVKVRIIDTLDDICQVCNKKKGVCSSSESALSDTKEAIGFGLKIGKTYFPESILRRMLPKDIWSALKRYIKQND